MRADFAPALIACLCYNGSMPDQPEQPILISAAGEAWAQAQRARRKPLAATTIESYCDAWRSFAGWAARQQKRAVAEIGVHDLASWIDSLTHTADGTALTYSHGSRLLAPFLAGADRFAVLGRLMTTPIYPALLAQESPKPSAAG